MSKVGHRRKERTIILLENLNAIKDHMRRIETETGRPYMQFRKNPKAFIQKRIDRNGVIVSFSSEDFEIMQECLARHVEIE